MTSSTRRGAGRGGATTFSSSSKKTDNNGLPENLLFDFRGPRFDDENPELTGPNLRVRSDRTIQFRGRSVAVFEIFFDVCIFLFFHSCSFAFSPHRPLLFSNVTL